MKHIYAITIALVCAGCGTPQVVQRTETVTVTHEVTVPVPAELTKDCAPAPLADTTVRSLVDRLAAVESSLAACRAQLDQIRGLGAASTPSR